MDKLISSVQNPFVKRALHLQKKRERGRKSQFLIEGYKELSSAVDASYSIEVLFFCADLAHAEFRVLLNRLAALGTKLLCCHEPLFRKISYRDNPDGFLAIAECRFPSLDTLSVTPTSFFLIAERIEKPGNLGAILRSADAAGAKAVIVVDECIDIYNPNVVRASVGALFSIPTISAEKEDVFRWLRKNHITTIAATPEAKVSYMDLQIRKSCAFVVGGEHEGLSFFWKENADCSVKIPMIGKVDSLNVATTATLLLFEAKRWMNL